MPEIPVIGFVVEALGAAVLAVVLHSLQRQHARAGVREWSLGLWAVAGGLMASVAAVHIPQSVPHPGLVALADIPYYWSRSLLLLGTWARWNDREAGRRRWLPLALATAVPVLIGLAPLGPTWRPAVRAGVFTALFAPATLAAGVLLLRVRSDVRRLGAQVLAVSFVGLGLEDLFLTWATLASFAGSRPPLTAVTAGHLIEVELLLLLFTGVGMVAWLLAEERESAVRLEHVARRREAMSAMGSLVAGVAHEVRNPLFAISSTVDALEARLGAQPSATQPLALLRGEVQRMSRLMNELLDYGRPVEPGLVTEALGGVLEEAVRACAALAADAGVRVEAERDALAQLVPMDRPRLVQVFQNAIQNAIQHTPPGRPVLVCARAEAREGQRGVRCTVRDSGPGFDPGDLGHVFEPFFSRRRGGTGLGLSIVRRIVQEHSGHVEASNHPDGGGVLSVWLPAAEAAVEGGGRVTLAAGPLRPS